MPASKEVQEYVKNELPYKILMALYEDSRAPLRSIGRDLNISHYIVSSVLKELEKRYDIIYTLELNVHALGFYNNKLITIKFGVQPSIDSLKNMMKNDVFVQDAYLATGDFDLVMYVVGLTPEDFQQWQFKLRIKLSEYKPKFNVSDVNMYADGFLPIKSELIEKSVMLSNTEKRVLTSLNDNSRIKMKDLVKKSKVSAVSIFYMMKRFKEKGIVKKYSALVQNPSKRIFSTFSVRLTPIKEHEILSIKLSEAILGESYHEITNDYCAAINTNGAVDSFYICTFKDGEHLSKRGPNLVKKLWEKEDPIIEQALLTSLIVGKWPFHLDDHKSQIEYIEKRKVI